MHPNQMRKLESLEEAFTAAKATEDADPKTYQKAKRALAAYRIRLRREQAEQAGPGDAVASATTLKAKATRPEGG